MAAAEPGAALPADGVDLVDEDQAGGVLTRFFKEIAYPRGADTDEHFNELGPTEAEKWHSGLAGHSLGEIGLAGSGRPNQQHTSRDAGADLGELFRVFQEFDHFGQFLLGLVDPLHILEGDGGTVSGDHARLAAPERHGLAIRTLGLPHHEDQQTDDKQDRQEGAEDRQHAAELAGLPVLDIDVLADDQAQGVEIVRYVGVTLDGYPFPDDAGAGDVFDGVASYHQPGHHAARGLALHRGQHLRIADRTAPGFLAEDHEKNRQHGHHDHQVHKSVAHEAVIHRRWSLPSNPGCWRFDEVMHVILGVRTAPSTSPKFSTVVASTLLPA